MNVHANNAAYCRMRRNFKIPVAFFAILVGILNVGYISWYYVYEVSPTKVLAIRPHVSSDNDLIDASDTMSFTTTVTKRTKSVTIDDVTITIKTTGRYHETRLEQQLNTWIKRVLNAVRTSSN